MYRFQCEIWPWLVLQVVPKMQPPETLPPAAPDELGPPPLAAAGHLVDCALPDGTAVSAVPTAVVADGRP